MRHLSRSTINVIIFLKSTESRGCVWLSTLCIGFLCGFLQQVGSTVHEGFLRDADVRRVRRRTAQNLICFCFHSDELIVCQLKRKEKRIRINSRKKRSRGATSRRRWRAAHSFAAIRKKEKIFVGCIKCIINRWRYLTHLPTYKRHDALDLAGYHAGTSILFIHLCKGASLLHGNLQRFPGGLGAGCGAVP